MKGYVMLTEGRSGSNWLGSLANGTGVMGNLEEWVDATFLGTSLDSLSPSTFMTKVLELAATQNGRFAVKLFPRHLVEAHRLFGFDFIRELRRQHDVSIVLLDRQDRLRQAISFAKGRMSGQWRSTQTGHSEAKYDFEKICRSYFFIERSYSYWRSYVNIQAIPHALYTYEELIGNSLPYFEKLSNDLDVEIPSNLSTDLRVQRNEETEEWLDRFHSDLASHDIVGPSALFCPPNRNFSNLIKFFKKEMTTPLPMTFGSREPRKS